MQVPKFLSELVENIEKREHSIAFDIIDAADIDISQPEERIVGILPESCLGILVAHYEKTVQYRNLKLRHANPPSSNNLSYSSMMDMKAG